MCNAIRHETGKLGRSPQRGKRDCGVVFKDQSRSISKSGKPPEHSTFQPQLANGGKTRRGTWQNQGMMVRKNIFRKARGSSENANLPLRASGR